MDEQKSKAKKITVILASIMLLAIVIAFLVYKPINYSIANNKLKEQNYQEAFEIFDKLGDYKDSAEISRKTKDSIYGKALDYEATSFLSAIKEYKKLPVSYKDVKSKLNKLQKYEPILGEYECYETTSDSNFFGSLKDINPNRRYIVDIYNDVDGTRVRLPNMSYSSEPHLVGYIVINNNDFIINIPKKDIAEYNATYSNGFLTIKEVLKYQEKGNVLIDYFIGGLAHWVEHEDIERWRKIS